MSIINFISISSMLISAILTISQQTLKRFLAMSSISYQGFLFLICFLNNYSYLFFLIIYSFTLLTFMILVSLSYNLFLPSILLFSLAGLPPLPGFFAKLYIIQELLVANYIFTVIILILSSLIITANYINL
jgi:NADH:ubiquinone oxidoreductase subunit 2 (subunit N)